MEFGFGSVDAVQTRLVTLNRSEGDRGVLTKSNEQEARWRLEVKNLSGRSWDIELLDHVSVSEQEDFLIEWTADPSPETDNFEDARGVLAWYFEMPAQTTQTVTLSETLEWPGALLLE